MRNWTLDFLLMWSTLSLADTISAILTAAEVEYIEQHLPSVLVGPAEGLSLREDINDWFLLESSTFVYEIPRTSRKTTAITLEQIGHSPGTLVGDSSDGWGMTLPNKTTHYLSKEPDGLEIAGGG